MVLELVKGVRSLLAKKGLGKRKGYCLEISGAGGGQAWGVGLGALIF